MTTVLKAFLLVFSLAACAAVEPGKPQETVINTTDSPLLTEKIQNLVSAAQSDVINALPDEIAGMKASEPVADREKNQKGAGFTRVYVLDDAVATVFIYNNQEFGINDEITPAAEALMNKHLQEIRAMQDSGLYKNVKLGNQKTRDFKWKGVKYQVLEAEAQFTQKGEQKKSFLVLGANKDLMSYVRIRFTYPNNMQLRINKIQNTFVRTVLVDLHNFVDAQKPKTETAE